MLILVAVDLAAANGWLVASAPAAIWSDTPKLATLIEAAQAESPDGGPYRVYRRPIWMPPSFKVASSGNRMAQAVRWDHDTLWPKYNLRPRIPLAEVHGAMMPYDYQTLLREMKLRGADSVPADADLSRLNVKYAIVRGPDRGSSLSWGENLGSLGRLPEDIALRETPGGFPRAWIVHQVELMRPIDPRDSGLVRRRSRDVFWPRGKRRDLRSQAVVEETKQQAPFFANRPRQSHEVKPAATQRDDREYCRVVLHQPLRVELITRLNRPGLVVLCDQFCPGWQLQVETNGRDSETVPILRTNRVMRGAWLPAGDHRLVWIYRPTSFRLGAAVSAISWLVLTIGLIGNRPSRRNFDMLINANRTSNCGEVNASGDERSICRQRSPDRTPGSSGPTAN